MMVDDWGNPALVFIEPNPYMTTSIKTVTPITGQTAKVGETYNRDRYEVHVRVSKSGKDWTVHARNATTLEQARQQVTEHRKPNPTLEIMIGAGPKLDYRIIHVSATCKVVE